LITELGKSYRNLKTYSQTKFAKGRRYGMKLFIPYINPFSCDRILFLDSDYKFYKHPNVVFDFIHNKYSSEFIYNAESFDPNESLYQKGDFPWRMVDNQYVALYDERELQTISSIIGRTIKYAPELNTGLLGMTTQSLNPKTIDSLLGALYSMGYNDNTPRFDLMEQALFSFIVGMSSSYLSLPKDEYVCTSKTQGIHKKSIGRHFLGPSKFSVNYLE
nr:hypothetical protein [Candidatus Woesebacteria bacterium]